MNLPPPIDMLESALADYGEAIRLGDAEALAALAAPVRSALAPLAAGRSALPIIDRNRIARQIQAVQVHRAILARRQQQVDQLLEVLGRSHAGLQERRAERVYAAHGGWSGVSLPSRGFASA